VPKGTFTPGLRVAYIRVTDIGIHRITPVETPMLRFNLSEKKALEALVFVAREWPEITAFYAAKVFFFADKDHLNKYGRPVLGDRYIAMDHGPVPSVIYDWFKGDLNWSGDPQAIISAVNFNRQSSYVSATAMREPEMDYLSPSDAAALKSAIALCKGRPFSQLSRLSHDDPAYREAELNAEMDPALMIEGEDREELLEAAKEFAAYGVG
jgi:hypothetical protein